MLLTTEQQLILASSAHNWVPQTTAIYFPSQGFPKNNSPFSSMPGSNRPAWLAVKSESEYKFWKQNPLHATEFQFSFITIERERWEITIKPVLGVHSDTEELWKATEFSSQYSNSYGPKGLFTSAVIKEWEYITPSRQQIQNITTEFWKTIINKILLKEIKPVPPLPDHPRFSLGI